MSKSSQTIKDIIQRYISIARQIKELKEEQSAHSALILDFVSEGEPYQTDEGTVSVVTRRTWKEWPDDIEAKDAELKELKAKAKQVGTATYEITKSIRVK